MAEIITAVYEKGILRPLQPLDLQELEKVRIQIVSDEPAAKEAKTIVRLLVEEGLVTPPPGYSDVAPLPEQERRELADRLGRVPGKPLSEIIIEDRGD